MSIDDDSGWMYPETGGPKIGIPNIGRIMQGEGFDEEDNPFRPSRDGETQSRLTSSEPTACTCDVFRFSNSANELLNALWRRPQMFPSSADQLESFHALGGYAHGPWSRFVNVGGSQAPTTDEFGYILLNNNCTIPGHWCKVWQTGDDTFDIEGLMEGQLAGFATPLIVRDTETDQEEPQIDTGENGADEDSDEGIADEADYDDRTFGDLDTSKTAIEDESTINAIKDWQDMAFPEQDIREYLANGLENEDVFTLARFMPANEVGAWVSKFGEQSMLALRILQMGLGAQLQTESTIDHEIQEQVDSIARGIRNLIEKEVKKYDKMKARTPRMDDESEQ